MVDIYYFPQGHISFEGHRCRQLDPNWVHHYISSLSVTDPSRTIANLYDIFFCLNLKTIFLIENTLLPYIKKL